MVGGDLRGDCGRGGSGLVVDDEAVVVNDKTFDLTRRTFADEFREWAEGELERMSPADVPFQRDLYLLTRNTSSGSETWVSR
jgi:hypothetical protein